MKKKKTLSTQLTFVISFIVLLIVGVFWMAITFLECLLCIFLFYLYLFIIININKYK